MYFPASSRQRLLRHLLATRQNASASVSKNGRTPHSFIRSSGGLRSFHRLATAGSTSITPSLLLTAGGGVGGPRSSPKQQQQQPPRRALHLTPREKDHLLLHQAGRLAQYRLARGNRLNHPEAVALLTMQLMESIRDGKHSVAELMSLGQQLLGRRQVLPGVPKLVSNVQVEATFPDGTKLLTVNSPITAVDGDLALALEGSFLPVPDTSVFGNEDEDTVIPGAVLPTSDSGSDITLNDGRSLIELTVTNTGDRPIQVGSHYAFVETNPALEFDRKAAIGRRLNVPSGASVRFEAGESKPVTLVELAGERKVV